MSWDDDPFVDVSDTSDRTIIKPNPKGDWGSKFKPPESLPRQPPQPNASDIGVSQNFKEGVKAEPYKTPIKETKQLEGFGGNALVNAAAPLLILVYRLRTTVSQNDVVALQDNISRQINRFEEISKSHGYENKTVLTARYLLCTSIDESALKTPWGSNSHWASRSLLSKFHNENFGGEKFYQITDLLLSDPKKNIDVIELIYLCIIFGFKGKYGIDENGSSKLTNLRNELYDLVVQGSENIRELSPHWQGVKDKTNALVKYVPLWVVAVVASVLLLVVYAGYSAVLSATSKPVYQEFEAIVKQPNGLVEKDIK